MRLSPRDQPPPCTNTINSGSNAALGQTFFCLVVAPDADAAHTVHREAHGLVADEIHQVQEGS